MKKRVVFDFDGVIHSYTSGWQGIEIIPDPPVPGIKEALKEITEAGYEIAVVSTRCHTLEGMKAITDYLKEHDLLIYVSTINADKPPAMAYIDDRAICFDGKPETLLSKIEVFRPWNK